MLRTIRRERSKACSIDNESRVATRSVPSRGQAPRSRPRERRSTLVLRYRLWLFRGSEQTSGVDKLGFAEIPSNQLETRWQMSAEGDRNRHGRIPGVIDGYGVLHAKYSSFKDRISP